MRTSLNYIIEHAPYELFEWAATYECMDEMEGAQWIDDNYKRMQQYQVCDLPEGAVLGRTDGKMIEYWVERKHINA